ncbi:MAG: hypothetical protein CMP71_01515 [Flavobacteriales bacterium]|nr:hypothetical protein [Flavobacteriales bacterium]|tara:strand:+ start:27164 stop:28069 length:906 start_codon:yes stop_codon:yes gene_type:complete
MKKKTVLILLSDKRSGSTMLQNSLCQHGNIQTVAYSPHTYLETHHWLKGAVILKSNNVLFSNNISYRGYGSRKNAKIYMIDLLKKNISKFNTKVCDEDLIFNGWEELCNKFCKNIFFEKSPQYLANWASLSLILKWMKKTEYDVKIIGLVRNPQSVQHSAQKLFGTDPEKRQFAWLKSYKNLIAFKNLINHNNYLELKYEDLVDHPKKNISLICKFIEVKYDENMIKHIHGDSKLKWKNDKSYYLKMDESVVQLANFFGYSNNDLIKSKSKNFKLDFYNQQKIKRLIKQIKDRIIRPMKIK